MTVGLFVALIAIVIKFVLDFEYIPNLVPIESVKNKYFDYIIIGAGTAGSVLAYELSKNASNSVLLIEAGGIFNGLSIIPLASTLMQGSQMDWSFKTVPQKYSSRGLENEQQSIPRGKGLGGSHSLNYLLHYNGIKSDFDQWTRLGADDWNYDNLKYFLNRHDVDCNEGNCGVFVNGNETDFPQLSILKVNRKKSGLAEAFMNAFDELKAIKDVDYKLARFTIKNGKRHSVYHEYLRRSFKRKNLKIIIHAKVLKIEFNSKKKATSVLISTASEVSKVLVRKEIILSAGTIHSPQILQLSGIGNEQELKKLGINVVHHLPEVGQNLFDHLNFPLFVSINTSASVTKEKILSVKEIYRYLMKGDGILSTTAVIGLGLFQDHGIILFGMGSADEKTLKNVANYKTHSFRSFFPLYANSGQEGFVPLSTCYLPKSRGVIQLDSNNVLADPLIDPKYLNNYDDVICMRKAVRLVVETIATKAFQKMGAQIHWPQLNECLNFGPFDKDFETNYPSDRYLDCLIRHGAVTAHHPGGTCAIGTVIDNELRVHGIKGLRVMDASIFPSPVSGTPNSIIIAMAERAAKLILNPLEKLN
ncbi:unnamed protein product [Diamesa tonsa]